MLKTPPNEKHLSRMYYELALHGANSSGEKSPWPYRLETLPELLALGAEMSRYDPRLLGILVEYFLNHWREMSPQELRARYPKMRTPQTLAVVAEFAKAAAQDPEAQYLMEYLQRGLKPVTPQFYFMGLYSPGGKLGQRAAEEGLAQYKRWGFMAREAPTIDVYKKQTVGHMDQASRLNVLSRLLREKNAIQLKEYLTALATPLSRQQALLDLKALARLRPGSKGRGAFWVLKKNR